MAEKKSRFWGGVRLAVEAIAAAALFPATIFFISTGLGFISAGMWTAAANAFGWGTVMSAFEGTIAYHGVNDAKVTFRRGGGH